MGPGPINQTKKHMKNVTLAIWYGTRAIHYDEKKTGNEDYIVRRRKKPVAESAAVFLLGLGTAFERSKERRIDSRWSGNLVWDQGHTGLNFISAKITRRKTSELAAVFTENGTTMMKLSLDVVAESYSLFKRLSKFGGGRLT